MTQAVQVLCTDHVGCHDEPKLFINGVWNDPSTKDGSAVTILPTQRAFIEGLVGRSVVWLELGEGNVGSSVVLSIGEPVLGEGHAIVPIGWFQDSGEGLFTSVYVDQGIADSGSPRDTAVP